MSTKLTDNPFAEEIKTQGKGKSKETAEPGAKRSKVITAFDPVGPSAAMDVEDDPSLTGEELPVETTVDEEDEFVDLPIPEREKATKTKTVQKIIERKVVTVGVLDGINSIALDEIDLSSDYVGNIRATQSQVGFETCLDNISKATWRTQNGVTKQINGLKFSLGYFPIINKMAGSQIEVKMGIIVMSNVKIKKNGAYINYLTRDGFPYEYSANAASICAQMYNFMKIQGSPTEGSDPRKYVTLVVGVAVDDEISYELQDITGPSSGLAAYVCLYNLPAVAMVTGAVTEAGMVENVGDHALKMQCAEVFNKMLLIMDSNSPTLEFKERIRSQLGIEPVDLAKLMLGAPQFGTYSYVKDVLYGATILLMIPPKKVGAVAQIKQKARDDSKKILEDVISRQTSTVARITRGDVPINVNLGPYLEDDGSFNQKMYEMVAKNIAALAHNKSLGPLLKYMYISNKYFQKSDYNAGPATFALGKLKQADGSQKYVIRVTPAGPVNEVKPVAPKR